MEKLNNPIKALHNLPGGHLFYFYLTLECYIDNAVNFLLLGIEDGNHIILIENDRIYSIIFNRLKLRLSSTQMERIHYINNYDFYWSAGNFNSSKIIANFAKILKPFLKKNIPVRTWAHVELGQIDDIEDAISQFERAAQESVTSLKLLSVCAYNGQRLPVNLIKSLFISHTHLMTDTAIIKL